MMHIYLVTHPKQAFFNFCLTYLKNDSLCRVCFMHGRKPYNRREQWKNLQHLVGTQCFFGALTCALFRPLR